MWLNWYRLRSDPNRNSKRRPLYLCWLAVVYSLKESWVILHFQNRKVEAHTDANHFPQKRTTCFWATFPAIAGSRTSCNQNRGLKIANHSSSFCDPFAYRQWWQYAGRLLTNSPYLRIRLRYCSNWGWKYGKPGEPLRTTSLVGIRNRNHPSFTRDIILDEWSMVLRPSWCDFSIRRTKMYIPTLLCSTVVVKDLLPAHPHPRYCDLWRLALARTAVLPCCDAQRSNVMASINPCHRVRLKDWFTFTISLRLKTWAISKPSMP